MRWKYIDPPPLPHSRILSWFAFWPVVIGDECRWLERVTVEQGLVSRVAERSGRRYWYRNERFWDERREEE